MYVHTCIEQTLKLKQTRPALPNAANGQTKDKRRKRRTKRKREMGHQNKKEIACQQQNAC